MRRQRPFGAPIAKPLNRVCGRLDFPFALDEPIGVNLEC
jgi:hypothetical protein